MMQNPHPWAGTALIISALLLAAPTLCPAQTPPATSPQEAAPALTGTAKFRADAEALRTLVPSPLAQEFLGAASSLPDVAPRTLYFDPVIRRWYQKADTNSLDEQTRATLRERAVDFYETKYGTPLAYARPIEILATAKLDPPVRTFDHARILDFGYGTIGHLKMLSALGASATGVDVDPMLPVLYSEPGDLSLPEGVPGAHPGTVTLVDGQFPTGPGVYEKIGTGYDLFISKNTLKNGYIHPAQPVDPRMLVHLGIPDEGFVHSLYATLKPGGVAIIYNLCPAPAPEGKPYIPWADGRCPFPREMWEKAGFRVIAFDVNDDAPARTMARALGWDKSGMNVDADLFAWYSVFQKPAE
jgi:hypothetical protein